MSKGNYNASVDIKPTHTFVVTPSPENWTMIEGIDLVVLDGLKAMINSML